MYVHVYGRGMYVSYLECNVAVWRMVPGFHDDYILNAIKHTDTLKVRFVRNTALAIIWAYCVFVAVRIRYAV